MPAEPPVSDLPPQPAITEEPTLTTLLANSLQDQINTTRDGFNRLESAVIDATRVAQRDMRVFAILLLLALLASVGTNVTAAWGDASIGLTPTPVSASAPDGVIGTNP